MKSGLGNLIALIVLTIGAGVVMATVSLGMGWPSFLISAKAEKKVLEIPRTPVSVYRVAPAPVEVISSYTGMIRPFERYTLGFEVGGRLERLGTNDQGKPLDQGDYVKQGQLLASLDDRLLVAQLKESKARLEQAQSDMNRAKELRSRGAGNITDAVFQDNVTKLQLAEAGLAMTEQRLADATLVAPVDGKISKRLVSPGESVNANQAIMEIVEVDRVLLVLGVPESQISEIKKGLPAHIELLARDKFGKKLAGASGSVYQVGETADDKTGLFEVEVLIDNEAGRLKPGLVAIGHIVTSQLTGYRLPMASAVYRDGKTYLFSVGDDGCAHTCAIDRWIEQGRDIVVPEIPEQHRQVVVRGQHRLIDGRTVEVTEVSAADLNSLQADVSQPNATVGAQP